MPAAFLFGKAQERHESFFLNRFLWLQEDKGSHKCGAINKNCIRIYTASSYRV